MAFVLSVLYIAFSLLSPGVLPEAIVSLHVNIILGLLVIVACLPGISRSHIASLPDIYLLFGLIVTSAIAMILTGWIGGVLASLGNFIPIVITLPFLVISSRTLNHLKILTAVLTVVAFFILWQGAAAHMAGNFRSPYIITELVGETQLYRYRGLGVLADPNDLAQFFIMVIPLLWLRWKKGKNFGNFVFTLLPAATLMVGIYLTHSRGAVIALVAVLWFTLKNRLGVIASSISAGVALLGAVALGMSGGRGLNEDDGGRIAAWATGLEVFRSHPLFGVGMGNFNDFNDTGLTAHNSYVLCLAELGIIGYFFWMSMIVFSWSGLSRVIDALPEIASSGEEDEKSETAASMPNRDREIAQTSPWLAKVQSGGRVASAPLSKLVLSAPGGTAYMPLEEKWPRPFEPIDPLGEGREVASATEMAWAARVCQASMVGLLTAAFFLSRTYSMTLYVMLGMAATLRIMHGQTESGISPGMSPVFRKVGMVVVGSIIFLYLFVRFHGGH